MTRLACRDEAVTPPNNPIDPTVLSVTRLASARRAPVSLAGYRMR